MAGLGAELPLPARVVLGHYGINWLTSAATGNFSRLQVITDSQFSVLTVSGAEGTPPTGQTIPGGTIIDLPFTAITKTSGIAFAVKSPA